MKSMTLALATLLLIPTTLFAGDPVAGKSAYTTCTACHGANGEGNKALGSPRIAGMPAWYTIRQLQNFKSGVRGKNPKDTYGMQMAPMAQILTSEKAIEDVSAYIETLKAPPMPATTGGNADKGKNNYVVCQTCHGAQGEGNKALGSPPLKGQGDWYLIRQLENYRNGIRGTDPKDTYGMQMTPMAKTLPDEQAIKDVVAYIRSL